NGIRHRHALAAQNLNLPKLRDDLVGLVSLVCHRGPPSWSKPYFKVDPFNGGGSKATRATSALSALSSPRPPAHRLPPARSLRLVIPTMRPSPDSHGYQKG